MSRYDSCKVTYFNRIVIIENKGSNNSPKKSKPEKTWQEILAESGHDMETSERTGRYLDESSKIG
jgi:hypothetical protein